ncbi:centrosomal protein of 128 kDa isoform X1 [Gadus chalcogrammus]|uniref:centrosomal protein of 128 kDa isoform X1 n=1 Tax=Gadus chalcogrammus TaxID=1042646 RepID=UPI0024C4CC0F|nr:centrosomal protein of 128 kDa isoform X1 [Gadus chalcogrammus]
MESSSGSDTYDRARRSRPRGRDVLRRPQQDLRGASGSGSAAENSGITEKISTLASTLQDTSRNLNKVDRMLGQYRDNTDDQAEAMALLKENLEESIGQLQSQRLRRTNGGVRSASASTLHTSDLEQQGSGSEGQRFHPTSPLKEYPGGSVRRRRSHSASVRFKDTKLSAEDIHCLHQSLRDLRCDQTRLSDDLDREILLRNRADVDTRRAMENLTEHLSLSQTQDSVSSRVDRRIQDLERVRGLEQRGVFTDERQQASGRLGDQASGREEVLEPCLLKSEREREKMEQEMERARVRLAQTEDSRDTLRQQLEEMREDLLRTGKEKLELQRDRLELQREVSLLSSQPHGQRPDRGESSGAPGPARTDLEREVAELRAQLCKASILGEVDELKKALELKERERLQLFVQVEALTTDLARREQQQLRMLDQLRDIQSQGKVEQREAQALLQESNRSREELKERAQDAVRQWRAKCRRLQREQEETKTGALLHASQVTQATKEKEGSQAQLKVLTAQTEAVRRELTEVLGRLAHREEELHRRDVELSEAHQQHVSLEQENREGSESAAALQEEARRHASLQARLREENQRLEEQADAQARRSQRDQEAHASLQAALKEEAASARAQLAQLTQRLTAEERSGRELQRDLQARLLAAQEEAASLGGQLRLEREVHRKELESLRAVADGGGGGGGRSRKEREAQEALRLCVGERDELQARLTEVKVDASSEREQSRLLRLKLDRMKEECDKLAQELNTREEEHSLLHRNYQQLKHEVDSRARKGEERRRSSEVELASLGQKVSRLEAEQEAVLSSAGEELDKACRSLARNAEDKLQAIAQIPGLVKDPHRWLAETKSKLRWLCEEVQEREGREHRLRRQQQQAKEQLKEARRSRDEEQAALLQRLHQQEKLLHSLGTEKKELLERSRRKEEELRGLQDRVLDLELSTRVALDHLESMPEKVSVAEDFRDLEESQRQREAVQQRYAKHKDIVRDLQHQLDQSKRRIQECREEKLDATSRSAKLASLSSPVRGPSARLASSPRSDRPPGKRPTSPEPDISPVNGARNNRNHRNHNH